MFGGTLNLAQLQLPGQAGGSFAPDPAPRGTVRHRTAPHPRLTNDAEVGREAGATVAPADRQQRAAVRRQNHRRQRVGDRPRSAVKVSGHLRHELRHVPPPGFVVDVQLRPPRRRRRR